MSGFTLQCNTADGVATEARDPIYGGTMQKLTKGSLCSRRERDAPERFGFLGCNLEHLLVDLALGLALLPKPVVVSSSLEGFCIESAQHVEQRVAPAPQP